MQSLIKVVNETRATLSFLCHVLKGGREGAGEPADAGDVPDVQQEGLCELRTVRKEGRWAEGRRPGGRGEGPCDKGRLTHGTNYPRQWGGGAPGN